MKKSKKHKCSFSCHDSLACAPVVLPACVCVCWCVYTGGGGGGGVFACFHILWCSAGSASCAVLMLKLHAE